MEREAFSRRLRQALAGAGCDDRSPTKLAHDFNRKFKGGDISVNTAHKWLRGETMPTQDKLRALAAWLGVMPEWLRFGESDAPKAHVVKEPVLSESDLDVVRAFRRLNAGHRQAVREMMLALERAERQRL